MLELKACLTHVSHGFLQCWGPTHSFMYRRQALHHLSYYSSSERLSSLIVLCSAVLEKVIHQDCALTCLVIYLLWDCAILILAFVLSSSM